VHIAIFSILLIDDDAPQPSIYADFVCIELTVGSTLIIDKIAK